MCEYEFLQYLHVLLQPLHGGGASWVCTVARPGFVPEKKWRVLGVYRCTSWFCTREKQSTGIPVESLFERSFHFFRKGNQRLHVRLSLVNYPGIGAFAPETKEKLQGRSDPEEISAPLARTARPSQSACLPRL